MKKRGVKRLEKIETHGLGWQRLSEIEGENVIDKYQMVSQASLGGFLFSPKSFCVKIGPVVF